MPTSFKATVEGDRICWLESSHGVFPPGRWVHALITPLGEPGDLATQDQRSQRRLAALRSLVRLHALETIQDPVAWQRDARADRPLPGREP